MKYSKLLSTAACALAVTSIANAGTIAGTGIIDASGGDTLIMGTSGTLLTSGIATAGYFTISSTAVADFATAYTNSGGTDLAAKSSLISAFVGLANDNFVDGATGFFGTTVPGGYVVGVDYGLVGAASPLLNQQLYTFWGDGATLGTSQGIGLAIHTGTTMTQDDNTPTPDSNDIGLQAPYVGLIRGATTSTTFDATALGGAADQSAAAFQLVGIPEPSAALLGALGVLGLLRRRRN